MKLRLSQRKSCDDLNETSELDNGGVAVACCSGRKGSKDQGDAKLTSDAGQYGGASSLVAQGSKQGNPLPAVLVLKTSD
jgi:hypothetical protein